MHIKYNAALSQHPQGIHAAMGANTYATTIHLILSALAKLSPLQELAQARVFVGLGRDAWRGVCSVAGRALAAGVELGHALPSMQVRRA